MGRGWRECVRLWSVGSLGFGGPKGHGLVNRRKESSGYLLEPQLDVLR